MNETDYEARACTQCGEMIATKDMTMKPNRQFHTKTAFEMSTELRGLIDAQPVTKFTELQAETTYFYKPSYGNGESVCTVKRLLPSKKMADVVFYGELNPRRITPTRYHGTFRPLPDGLHDWLSTTHEQVIDAAIAQGLEVPARVRVYYPEKFTELPERFSLKQLQDALRPQWSQYLTAEAVATMIEERHKGIRRLDLELPKVTALNPAHVQDYERYIANHNADIDFYRWLQPLVAEGGVFYVSGEKSQPAH